MIQSWKLGLATLVISGAITSLSNAYGANCAYAQITPDNTLGNENSTVKSTGSVDAINGGATRGANLLHSFGEFNVNEGRSAYFTNPAGIENILSRVTGGNPSQILGKLGVLGNANLFLINPKGIIFGSNASLDVRGSFVGTTANGMGLTNGDIFSANPAEPLPSGLLNVNPNALLFNQIKAREIVNHSTAENRGLQVPQGKSLLLVGGDVNLNGGQIFAPGGRVELGGVAGGGSVDLNIDNSNLRLSFPESVARADVFLTNGADVNVRAGGGGSIAINAQNLNLAEESNLLAGIRSGLGSIDTQAGDIEINTTGTIDLTNKSFIVNRVERRAIGKGGDIKITAGTLSVSSGVQLLASTLGQGDAGNIIINARDRVFFDGRSSDPKFLTAAFSSVDNTGIGKGGDIQISTGELSLTNGAQLVASTDGEGDAGTIIINARDRVSFDGRSSDGGAGSDAFSDVGRTGRGQGGDIRITTGSFSLTNGAQLVAITRGQGDAGNVIINANEGIYLNGTGRSSRFFTGVGAVVEIGAVGKGGSINITTPGGLYLSNGALLSTTSAGNGAAGNIEVAARSIRLDNQALLSSRTIAGQEGNIFLRSGDLILRRGSNITTDATGTASGGNINIDTDLTIALEDSNITANAQAAFGGRVIIDTQGIFRTADTDITASSELGTEFNGTVDINTPGIEPNSGLINLPVQLVEARVAQTCQPSGNQAQSEFVVTGRGGLPPSPDETLSSDAIQVDWVTLNPKVENRNQGVSTNITTPEPNSMVEATGWTIAHNGDVLLRASATPVLPGNSRQTPAKCSAS